MSNQPFNRNNLSKAGIAGAALAAVGIVLFVVLWVVLGELGADSFSRLMISLCLPPAIMAGAVGGYILLNSRLDKSGE